MTDQAIIFVATVAALGSLVSGVLAVTSIRWNVVPLFLILAGCYLAPWIYARLSSSDNENSLGKFLVESRIMIPGFIIYFVIPCVLFFVGGLLLGRRLSERKARVES